MTTQSNPTTPKTPIPILYEDEDCLVFNKPANLLVVPTDSNEPQTTLVSVVNQQYHDRGVLLPAHRLDRDTTGAILFAKGKANEQVLMQFFKDKEVKKAYIAFVHGRVKVTKGKISIPIKDMHQQKFQKHLPEQSALTHYEVQEYYKDFTVVKVMPITGRTNQIRIHFAKIGHPLVGEDKYAFRKDFALRFRRTALHALRLEWPHPVKRNMVCVEVPMPEDMANFLKKN